MQRRLLLALPLLALARPSLAAPARLKVVASMSVLGDMVRQIAGEAVSLTTLVGANGDVHAFEPTPAAAKALAQADLVIVNGLGLEGWMDRLVGASGFKGRLVTASEGVLPRRMAADGVEVTDPHAWQSLGNGAIYVRNIAMALAAADPAHEAAYVEAGRRFVDRIAAMDGEVRAEIAKVPPAQRKVVTSHDAFGYFGTAYGVTFLAAEGLAEDAEPSAAGIRRLIDQVRQERVKVLFFENALSPRLIRQIGRETGAVVGGTLYADALSEPGGPADSYLGMFRHNVPLLRDAMLASGGEG